MKKVVFAIVCMAVVAIVATTLAFRTPQSTPNAVAIHDAVIASNYAYTTDDATRLLTAALTDVFTDMDAVRLEHHHRLRIFIYVFVGFFTFAAITLCVLLEIKILAPFRKMKDFAYNIAIGRLDVPLEMDRGNMFGAFTESFDLMREELRKARESEAAANKSKKELVATLSHDIKTPVASIKAITELMMAMQPSDKDLTRLATITNKAEQINSLITNMFHATLEELHALAVTPAEVASTEIARLISSADYNHRAGGFTVPECIAIADPLRLQQVFDNIFANAYKYANTDMYVTAHFCENDGQHLIIEVKDFGQGVQADDLPLLFNKFYRAKSVERISGHGLGLYIAKHFMKEMGGDLLAENHADGFVIQVLIRLA